MGKHSKAEAEAKEGEEHVDAEIGAVQAAKMKKDKKKKKKKASKKKPVKGESEAEDAMVKDNSDNKGKEKKNNKKKDNSKKERSGGDDAEAEEMKEAQKSKDKEANQDKTQKTKKKKDKKHQKKKKNKKEEKGEGSSDDEQSRKRAKVSSKQQGSGKRKSNGTGNGAAGHGDSGIRFDFYEEHEALSKLTPSSIKEMRKKDRVDVHGFNGESTNALKPVPKFGQSGMRADVMKVCSGFEKPTPIQKHTWSIVLRGRDVVGIAATGSGKTLAFGLPGLVHSAARGRPARGTPFMLALAPTRELAMQTAKVLQDAGQRMEPQLNVQCIYGGAQRREQIQAMKQGVHAIVATPGRLLDLCEAGAINLSAVSFCVLDEADRMLDLGFERDIKRIMTQLGSPRQTLMFSATWPKEVRKIAKDYQNKPVKVTVGSDDLEASKSVTQIVDVVEPKAKNGRLLDLLRQYHKSRKNKVLIFALYKKEAARLESFLQFKGYNTRAIHGDLSQGERSHVLQEFKSGRVPLMIATDVAARGLDVPDVEYVINYTFPLTVEEYVHRIGRTGRAGAKGTAHTFFTQHDKHHAGALGNVLRQAGVEVPQALMKFGQHTKRKVHPVYGAHYRQAEDLADAEPTRITFDSDSDEE